MRGLVVRFRTQLRDPVTGPLVKGGLSSMGARVAGTLLSFASHILLSRLLGVQGYGVYVIALGWVLVLVIPGRMGLDNAALRFATIYREEKRLGALRGLILLSVAATIVCSGLLGLVLLFAKLLGVEALRPISLDLVIWVAAMIAPLALLGWFSAMIRTTGRIFASQFYEQVLRPAILILLLLAAVAAGPRIMAAGAMGLTFASTIIACAAIAVHCAIVVRRLGPAALDLSERRTWFSVSWVLLILSLLQELLNQIEVLLLGAMATASQAAQFAAAARLASLIGFGLVAIVSVSGPAIASAYRERDRDKLAKIARLNARASTGFAVVVALALAAIGPVALRAFGPDFPQAYPALLVLLIGGLVNAATGSVAYLMILTGHHVSAVRILAGALGLSMLLNVLLIPSLGIIGSAIASSAGLSVWNLAMLVYVRRRLGIDASILGLAAVERPLPA